MGLDFEGEVEVFYGEVAFFLGSFAEGCDVGGMGDASGLLHGEFHLVDGVVAEDITGVEIALDWLWGDEFIAIVGAEVGEGERGEIDGLVVFAKFCADGFDGMSSVEQGLGEEFDVGIHGGNYGWGSVCFQGSIWVGG